MRFVTITTFAVTGTLVALSIANPLPNWKAGGIAIPLTRHSSSLKSNKTIDLNAMTSHCISVREKILSGLDNYEVNTGTMHPFAVKRSESELERRGASVPLISYRDNIWLAEISIGTPPKTLKVQIDTGAADMWILQTGCEGISGDRDLWDPQTSESAEIQDQSFRFEYGDGTIVQGDSYTDNITIGGFTADPQTFGSVLKYNSMLQNNVYADGLLGLAYPSVSIFGALPLFASLVGQGRLINPTFSLKLSSSGAEMYVGGANSMLYKGDITYIRITNPGLWEVSMDDVRVNGDKIFENVPAIFDTGTNYILGDWERVSELYGRLDGTLEENGGFGYYYLPCDSFPSVSFTFSGKTFQISPEDFRLEPFKEGLTSCYGAIIGQRLPIGFWTIGHTFFQGVYSVFDYNTFQVGFADLA